MTRHGEKSGLINQKHQRFTSKNSSRSSYTNAVISEKLNSGSFITVSVNRRIAKALLDTGSNFNLASSHFCSVNKIAIQPLQFGQRTSLWAANGSELKVVGNALLDLRIKGLTFPTDVYVVEGLADELICGVDFISEREYLTCVIVKKSEWCFAPFFTVSSG